MTKPIGATQQQLDEKNEWCIQIDDVKYQLDRFVFED